MFLKDIRLWRGGEMLLIEKTEIRKLIIEKFDKYKINYDCSNADFVDDIFTDVESAIIEIIEECSN